jgi:predicted AAA+ superfamily ATPase
MMQLLARHGLAVARDILTYSPSLLIEGARQVGKSTLAGQLASETDALVVNLDDQDARAAATEDPVGFVTQAGDRCLIIDEIQRVPTITLTLKSAIDTDRRPGRFILTGSSSLLRVKGLADSLAGRVGRLSLYGFSQGELSGHVEDFSTTATELSPSLIHHHTTSNARSDYARIIATGSYPDATGLTDHQRSRWLDDYLQALIRRDLPELRRIVRPDRVMSVLRLLAAHQSGELVKAKLSQEAGIPTSTIDSYLDLLAQLWLVAVIPTWTPNLSQREVARPKSLIVDSGLATRLCRLTSEQLATLEYGGAFGMLLEGFVASELMKQRTWTQTDFELYHYRDRSGVEVDFIMERSDGIVALEVKSAASFQSSHFKGLKFLRDKLGDRFIAGVVLNTGSKGYRFSDRLYGLPISALWELGAS